MTSGRAVGLPGVSVAAADRWVALDAMRAAIAAVLEVEPDASTSYDKGTATAREGAAHRCAGEWAAGP